MREWKRRNGCKIRIMTCNKTVYYERKIDFLIWAIKWPFRTVLFCLWLIVWIPSLFVRMMWAGIKGFCLESFIFLRKNEFPEGMFVPLIVLWNMISYRKKKVERDER